MSKDERLAATQSVTTVSIAEQEAHSQHVKLNRQNYPNGFTSGPLSVPFTQTETTIKSIKVADGGFRITESFSAPTRTSNDGETSDTLPLSNREQYTFSGLIEIDEDAAAEALRCARKANRLLTG